MYSERKLSEKLELNVSSTALLSLLAAARGTLVENHLCRKSHTWFASSTPTRMNTRLKLRLPNEQRQASQLRITHKRHSNVMPLHCDFPHK